ncbi:HalOD1 output domain-containing protein [Natrinema salinisoli]|uniref:HalOD1 output domain-containing protein n=1 Tax=Natrinema salinisoli TaxID=2878535 RepID=UPI001CEFCEB9|nr:HalOD1 output domain-containing protein [Natrinema salinisoli]
MSDHTERKIVHRELDTAAENPIISLINAIADIEDTDTTELPTMYDCVDGMLDELFSNPPAPESQMVVEFSYETYRITVEQDGTAKFVKTE